MEQIGLLAIRQGWEVCVIHSCRYSRNSELKSLSFSNLISEFWHALWAFLFDRQGLLSICRTKKAIREIDKFHPDVIHLHNLHGYYLNYKLLSNYLSKSNIPVVWTMHDCWPFTGHCTYFDTVNCERWKTQCYKCPNLAGYPRALIGNAKRNYRFKKNLFTSLKNLTLVPVSNWLANLTRLSYLNKYPVKVIHNGVDLNVFRVLSDVALSNEKIILGVSSNGFAKRKGLEDFISLARILPQGFQIILIGLKNDEFNRLPSNIIGLTRTDNVYELVNYYNRASVFVNPTYSDNFPTTNIEALACGTPVITYDTGGSAEAIDNNTGVVVNIGDVSGLAQAIIKITGGAKPILECRRRAELLFDKNECYASYLKLYESLTS